MYKSKYFTKIQPFPENKSIYAEKIKVNEIIAIDGIDVKKGMFCNRFKKQECYVISIFTA